MNQREESTKKSTSFRFLAGFLSGSVLMAFLATTAMLLWIQIDHDYGARSGPNNPSNATMDFLWATSGAMKHGLNNEALSAIDELKVKWDVNDDGAIFKEMQSFSARLKKMVDDLPENDGPVSDHK